MNGGARNLTPVERLFGPPASAAGRISLGLAALFFAGLPLLPWGPGMDRWPGAAGTAVVAGCAVASGILGGIAIWRKGERFVFLFLTLLLGALVTLFLAMEMAEGLHRR